MVALLISHVAANNRSLIHCNCITGSECYS